MPSCNSNVDVSEYDDMGKVLGKQTGGSIGYNLRIENEQIGGQAEVTGYSVQPKLVEGRFMESDTDALCDPTAMTGGSRNKRKRSKRSNNKRSKRSNSKRSKRSNSKRSNKQRNSKRSNSKRNSKRSNKQRNSKRSNKQRNSKQIRRKMRGGNAPYETSYTNQESVYSPDMESRGFGCKQPNWDTKCA